MKVKILLSGFIMDISLVPDDTGIEVIEGIFTGKIFNSTDLKRINNNQNFNC
ncbi:hypothetical protein [Chryseobacterium indoltheticum]|uniref:Uncharacterized protein n=1 Tax=Chryseobacterium indoltheticum TaxID=254 RepID=A0A381F3Q1_9FLAO|nr:hypothetical protein [Chryseobacterium indoltheticum]SIQ35159.1 hypothetical protein SAMN05421682_104183 [Chryseobacterium indoltheticum]SUX41229.1 Uncharacterised protein [Chryseobacterium indoltheticum]